MQAVDKYDLIRILKEPNMKTLTLNEVLYAIERATVIVPKPAKRHRLTEDEVRKYVDSYDRKFDCICANCECLCFATDNYCANCGAELEDE